MAKNISPSANVNDRMKQILKEMYANLGGVDAIFLMDLDTAKSLSNFPEDESENLEFIGNILSNNIYQLETQAAKIAQSIFVSEMEMQTDDGKQIFVSRVEKKIFICIVATRELKTGFAKRLCEGPIREEILVTLQRMGFQVGLR